MTSKQNLNSLQAPDGSYYVTVVDGAGNLTGLGSAGYPSGAVPLSSAANGAAASVTVGLAAAVGKTTYITGFEVTGSGATAASVIYATVSGTTTNLAYAIAIPAGVTAGITPLIVEFPYPIPASATNTGIFVSTPSFGAGNTNAAIVVHGFQL